ncbi:MAG: hypothetical protein AB7U98_09375 [Candidatus Nitrosocosmicus sp.]
MSNSILVLLLHVVAIVIISSNLLVGYSQPTVELMAEFKLHENILLASNDVYQITNLSFNTTDKNICPIINNCKYSLEKGELRYNAPNNEYAVEGLLKINLEGEKNSKLYDIRIDVMDNRTTEGIGTAVKLISGNVSIGGNAVFNPYFEYKIVNGSLTFYDDMSKIDVLATKL